MRKIISRKEDEKKRKKNQLIGGIVLIFVMFSSVIGYSLSGLERDSSQSITYNGVKFIKESGFWNANLGDFKFSFSYNPNQVEKVNSELNLINSYEGKPLYFYSENPQAETEIYRNIFYQNKIAQRVQYACLGGEACENDAPLKTCEDKFIIIKESEINKITQQDNCVFIEGKKEDLLKLSDSFLFKIIGIQ